MRTVGHFQYHRHEVTLTVDDDQARVLYKRDGFEAGEGIHPVEVFGDAYVNSARQHFEYFVRRVMAETKPTEVEDFAHQEPDHGNP